MESLPSIARDVEEVEGFGDYYYYLPHNFTTDEFGVNQLELCKIARPANTTAQALTTVMSMAGILLNLVAIFVMVVLKEYKKSGHHWLILQLMTTNFIFLLFVFLQLVNEHHGKWVMGKAMCKIDGASVFTSHDAGVVFLVIANVFGIFSEVGLSLKWLPSVPCRHTRLIGVLKSALILFCVWMPCALVNIPLYKYNSVSDCERCIMEFPIEVGELCPMFGLNTTTCVDMMNFFMEDEANDTEYAESEYFNFSGEDYGSNEFDQLFETNLTKMAEMSACKYEEPRSFYVWLFASFALFYAMPIPILVIFGCLWFYDVMRRKNKKMNFQNKGSMLNVIFALDVMFFVCWTPWNSINMKKAYGGLQGRDGYQCATLIHYARFCALIYNTIAPAIYAAMTNDFRSRLMTAFNLLPKFCYHLLNMTEKNSAAIVDTDAVTSSDDALTEATTDGTAAEGNGSFTHSHAPPTATAV